MGYKSKKRVRTVHISLSSSIKVGNKRTTEGKKNRTSEKQS